MTFPSLPNSYSVTQMSIGNVVEKREFFDIVGIMFMIIRNIYHAATSENCVKFPQNLMRELISEAEILLLLISKGITPSTSKGYLHYCINCCIIHNNKDAYTT